MDQPSVQLSTGEIVKVGTIYCIGRNYAEHARELNNPVPTTPVVFFKSRGALRPLAGGSLAFAAETFHHEAEIVLLVGEIVALGEAADVRALCAIGLGLDLTRRGEQTELKAKGLPWTTAKSFAGSAIVTPFVPLASVKDPSRIRFSLEVNGELRQRGDTMDMLFPVPRMLSYLASLAPLYPGDLIYTGTPAGVGPIKQGDKLRLMSPDLGLDEQGIL